MAYDDELPADARNHRGHGHVHPRSDGFVLDCGGVHHCADCALESIVAADEGAEPEPAEATMLFVGLRDRVTVLTKERDRYREVLAVIANLGDADCASPGVAAFRDYVRRQLHAAGLDFAGGR